MTTLKTNGTGGVGLLRQISDWYRKRCDYRQLMAMDDHLLKDIGISRSQIADAINQTSPRAMAPALKPKGLGRAKTKSAIGTKDMALMTSQA
jgi:uncharacterized protein YjiS (DUF1127 family)